MNFVIVIYIMKFITEKQFVGLFENDNPIYKSFARFLKGAQVKSARQVVPLMEYIQDKSISTTDLKLLYENLVQKNEYLGRFYKVSMNVLDKDQKLSLKILDDPMKSNAINNDHAVHYKNVIRNMHYMDILKKTKSGIENNPTFLHVLSDLYLHAIIDYKILTPSAIHYMREGRLGSVFSFFYFRASIMNPLVPYSLGHGILRGERVFTPTLGWSSYCYGFLECPQVVEYVGTDVIPGVCKKTLEFAEKYYPEKKTTIFCEPSENLMLDAKFRRKYGEYFDVVFFSPPYYRLEMYAGENQSTEKYKTYSAWLENYWRKTMILCYHVLKPGGKMAYILSGYGSDNTKGEYDLLGDMNKIAKAVFDVKRLQVLPMYNKNVHVTTHRETAEKIIVFKK